MIEVSASPGRVWHALTDSPWVRLWSEQPADIDARKGGFYRFGTFPNGREAHVDVFELDRRLRLIYLHSARMPTSGSAVVDDILLDTRSEGRATTLRVLGFGVPGSAQWDAPYARMRQDWERWLARLKVAVEAATRPAAPAS
ncbi:MAG: hypothetical protein NVSMB10_08970 [Steroidobacteraceae bacterium]